MIDYGLMFYLIAVITFIGSYWIISSFKLAIANFKNDLRIRIFIIDPRTEKAYKEFYTGTRENIDKRKEFYFLEMDKRIPNSRSELKKMINDIVNESYEFNRDNAKV